MLNVDFRHSTNQFTDVRYRLAVGWKMHYNCRH